MSHPGTDSHGALRMEFPGGWPDHESSAFTGEGLADSALEAQQFMRTLLNWRKDADVIHNGKLMQYTPMRGVYVYFRYDDDDTVMVVFNRGDEAADIDLERFNERLDPAAQGTDVITGASYDLSSRLEIGPQSVLLLEVTQ